MTTISKIINSQTFRRSLAFIITVAVHLWVNRNSFRDKIGTLFVYRYDPDVPVFVTPPVKPYVSPLYEQLDELVSLSARNLRKVTGSKRRCSKYLLASHYLSFA
jgi:hypothetical protein